MPSVASPSAPRLLSGTLLVAASALLFSTKAVVVKCAYPYGIDALALLALRMGFALPVFLALVWREERRAAAPLPAGDLVRCLGLGVLGYYLASLLDFHGLRFIGVGLERTVLFLYPTVVVLVGAACLRQRPGLAGLGALAATYVGIILTYVGQGSASTASSAEVGTGVALVAGSAIAYALFVLWSGAAMRRCGALRFMAWAMSAACAAVLVHFALAAWLHGDAAILHQPPAVYGFGALLAIAGTVAPSLLMGAGLERVGAQRFAIISTIGPVGTVLLGWLVLGEEITVLNALGMALTIAASAAIGVAKRAAAPAATPPRAGPG